MLWRVRDFKGVKAADLDIRTGKTTVLTGVNSSGKSSVIQSLLLAAQSLHSDTQVVLNGPLVRLGDAQDLVREGSASGAIQLTVGVSDLNPTDEQSLESELFATFNLAPGDDRSSLRVTNVRVSGSNSDVAPLVVGRENARSSDVSLAIFATQYLGARDALHFKSLLGSNRRQLRTFLAMQGLRPVAVAQLMEPAQVESRYRAALASVLGPSRDSLSAPGTHAASAKWGAAFVREFVQLLSSRSLEHVEDEHHRELVSTFVQVRNGNPYAFERIWGQTGPDDRGILMDIAARVRAERPHVVVPIRGAGTWLPSPMGLLEVGLIETLGPSSDALNSLYEILDTLGDRVQYLGPLRDEPRVVWNHWNELAHGLPVGTRGEYSAAVLSRFGAKPVVYHAPDNRTIRGPLLDAVNSWLAYLNIGDNVAARPQGKLGVGFDLKVDGQIRDLTSVGVGVSQALPLLVGLMSCPPNSLFIVEQPELHLHPAVQARLADLVLTARPDVAVIVETHSEAFITRIRRRAAEGLIDTDRVDITFVEPDGGGSVARTLALSEYGDLSDWPEGFLSGAALDVQAIIAANVARSVGRNGD